MIIDILAIISWIILFVFIAQMSPEIILKRAGIFCIISGIYANIHIILSYIIFKLNVNVPSFMQKILSDYKPDILVIIYYISSILVGYIFVSKISKDSSGNSIIMIIIALIYIVPTIINAVLSFSYSSLILVISSISFIIGTIKQQIYLHHKG